MKIRIKFIILTLITILTFSRLTSYGRTDNILKGHWAEGLVDRDFLAEYLSSTDNRYNNEFEPDKSIGINNFIKTINLILSAEGFSTEYSYLNKRDKDSNLLRREVAVLLVDVLDSLNIIEDFPTKNSLFLDIDYLSENEIAAIKIAHSIGIIKGYSEKAFAPEDTVTHIQGILLLQRFKGVLEMSKQEIPFKVIQSKNFYSGVTPGIISEKRESGIYVTTTLEFPTPGYGVKVNRIGKLANQEYCIYLSIIQPDEGAILPQVIAYTSITIAIDSEYIEENAKFIVVPPIIQLKDESSYR